MRNDELIDVIIKIAPNLTPYMQKLINVLTLHGTNIEKIDKDSFLILLLATITDDLMKEDL